MTPEREDMLRCVQNGIQWLDLEHPGWRSRLDLKTLDMGSTQTCVVAQLFGEPGDGVDPFGKSWSRAKLNDKKCGRRGFDLQDRMYAAGVTYGELTMAWVSALG